MSKQTALQMAIEYVSGLTNIDNSQRLRIVAQLDSLLPTDQQ